MRGNFVKKKTMTKFEEFKKLHFSENPLLIGNVWNVQNALQFKKLGFKAVGTSSAAIAADLGYEDGENMPFEDYFFMIKRIASSVNIPFSVDLEAGYGKTSEEIISNIIKLHEIGVVGINIEDSIVHNHGREIVSIDGFTVLLKEIIQDLKKKNVRMFVNIRCDAFLLDLPNALEEAKFRISQYEICGIDGIFLPCITNEGDIKAITAFTKLPLNVMCMPNLPNFEVLKTLGVKRISMGNFATVYLNKQLENVTEKVIQRNDFSPLF